MEKMKEVITCQKYNSGTDKIKKHLRFPFDASKNSQINKDMIKGIQE